ncbi:type III-B CRISPR module-associated Cmr3 family protein [Rosettibacter firmus]|uniref:type III-B CRISPR module-associated Cmr3 family protein n=1 Tax=Rosettibacter firmus TaxID=3111522 RepID=UPI00336C02CB
MSIPHLITFKPAGKFYFGTSQSFGESFYAKSLMFPSQTTILGTLRAKILGEHNKLDLKTRLPLNLDDDLKELTGTSEMKGIDDPDDNFGKILKISPVFIVRQKRESECPEDFLLPAPADVFQNEDGKLYLVEFKPEENSKVITGESNHLSFSAGKKMKDSTAAYLGGIQFWNEYKEYKQKKKLTTHSGYFTEKIIIADSQHGIARKDRTTREEEGLFYIKNDYRMNDDYAFGVIVHLSEENVIENNDVFMGGERSLFKMKVERLPKSLPHLYTNHPVISRFISDKDYGDYNGNFDVDFDGEKLVLISPFFGNNDILRDLKFALISGMHSPRFLSSRKEKTDSFRAIPTGSVLFPANRLVKIKTYPAAIKIGYNFAIKF